MRPLDPRLVRSTAAVRVHLAVTVACGFAATALILLQAWLVARVIGGATAGALDTLGGTVAAVGAVALARAALTYGAETAALRSAARVKSDLRRRLVRHVATGDPATTDAGELATLATRGLDALDDYVAR
jgi:ATP-binding cassette subfamily C protein CydD